jgi:hypothetical protein
MAHAPRFDITNCTKVVKLGLLLSIIRVPEKMLDADIEIEIKQKLQFKYDIHPKATGIYCLNVYHEITQTSHNTTQCCAM